MLTPGILCAQAGLLGGDARRLHVNPDCGLKTRRWEVCPLFLVCSPPPFPPNPIKRMLVPGLPATAQPDISLVPPGLCFQEVIPALRNMVAAARIVREEYLSSQKA